MKYNSAYELLCWVHAYIVIGLNPTQGKMVLLLAIISILQIFILVVIVILGRTSEIKIQAGSLYARHLNVVC
jgi:hypothetical protein